MKTLAGSYLCDIDFIPTEEYTRNDAMQAIGDARFVLDNATLLIKSSDAASQPPEPEEPTTLKQP